MVLTFLLLWEDLNSNLVFRESRYFINHSTFLNLRLRTGPDFSPSSHPVLSFLKSFLMAADSQGPSSHLCDRPVINSGITEYDACRCSHSEVGNRPDNRDNLWWSPNTDWHKPPQSVPMWALREGSVGRFPFFKDRIGMEGSCIWTLNRWSQQIKELVLGSDSWPVVLKYHRTIFNL